MKCPSRIRKTLGGFFSIAFSRRLPGSTVVTWNLNPTGAEGACRFFEPLSPPPATASPPTDTPSACRTRRSVSILRIRGPICLVSALSAPSDHRAAGKRIFSDCIHPARCQFASRPGLYRRENSDRQRLQSATTLRHLGFFDSGRSRATRSAGFTPAPQIFVHQHRRFRATTISSRSARFTAVFCPSPSRRLLRRFLR